MSKKNSYIVIGAGRFGTNVAQKLNRDNYSVVIIDKNNEAFNGLDDFSGYIIHGDATDTDVLTSAGIDNARGVVIATDSDNLNIYLADVCFSYFDVSNVYVKIDDSRKAVLLDKRIKVTCPFVLSLNEFDRNFEETEI